MGKKITIDDVIELFESAGYELLETEYIRNHIPMRFRCPNHPEKISTISYKSLKKGCRCLLCSGKEKHDFEDVKKLFDSKGYELLETDYKNAMSLLKYRCKIHPDKDLKIRFNDLKNNKRGCPHCAGLAKPTFDEVKNLFENKGYVLLEDNYINTHRKMRYICPNHSDKNTKNSYHDLKAGHGCKYCGREKAANSYKGENHPFWGGGVSELTHHLRKQMDRWKFDCLKRYDFRCAVTGKRSANLHVHHTKPFHVIRDEVLKGLNMPIYETIGEYTSQQLDSIINKLYERHEEIVGVPLLYEIHRLFHNIYGNKTTIEDFLEFKQRYNSGEFIEASA